MSWRDETMLWLGDGFTIGSSMVGKRVRFGPYRGTVLKGDSLTLTVRWDMTSRILMLLKSLREMRL